MDEIILTGIKPTGTPHIGNFFGAIQPALSAKDQTPFYFIADYHALTTLRDPEVLKQSCREVAATWLALGLDPEKAVFYRQSDVPEIFELQWVLSCFTSKGLLNRAHAYKTVVDDNLQNGRDPDKNINAGTYGYPVLMAADILAFNAAKVPVGQDQKQHIEIVRDIAETFNKEYKVELLTLPEPVIEKTVQTIVGLDGRKMSKNYNNTIPLFLPEKALRKKVMQIKTDSLGVEDVKDPETCTVFALYQLIANESDVESLKQRYLAGGMGYGDAKQTLFEALDAFFAESRGRYEKLLADDDYLDEVLVKGAEKARSVARQTLFKVKKTIGVI